MRHPFGPYAAVQTSEQIRSADEIWFSTILRNKQALVGAAVTFRGHRFFLGLTDRPLPLDLRVNSMPTAGWESSRLVYRLSQVSWKVGRKVSHYCHIMWPVAEVAEATPA